MKHKKLVKLIKEVNLEKEKQFGVRDKKKTPAITLNPEINTISQSR